MPTKKKKRNSKDSNGIGKNSINGDANGGNGAESGGGTTAVKKKGKKKGGGSKGKSFQYDIFNDAAMENAYYCCHNVQDVLKSRGFAWPEAQKKKKKGKR